MKDKLYEVLKNPNDKLIAIDMDGVICTGEFWGDGEPEPNQPFIDYMWKLYKAGGHIVVYTARQPRHYPATHAWLIKHEVPFHGITMCMKPGADIYLDDKALNTQDIEI